MNRREFMVFGGAAVMLTSNRTAFADQWPSKSAVVLSA